MNAFGLKWSHKTRGFDPSDIS